MKKIVITIFCLLALPICISAQSGWVWQNPLPQGSTLTDIQFLSGNTGYASGGQGYILKTTNAGDSWQILSIPTSYECRAINFIDLNNGFCGSGTELFKTTNGGVDWQLIFTNIPPNTGHYMRLLFLDLFNGFASLGGGKIGKTTDGGLNWSYTEPNPYTIFSFGFINNSTGAACGQVGALYRTTDAGGTWTIHNTGTTSYLNSLFFTNSSSGFVAGADGFLRKTTNGGENWNVLVSSGTTRELLSINFADQNTGLICGTVGTILRTSDEGNSWHGIISNSNNTLKAVDFADGNTAVIVGEGGIILKTTNTGLNWSSVNQGTLRNIEEIEFIDSQYGYAVGDSGTVLKTTNGGINWLTMPTFTNRKLLDLEFLNNNTGFIVDTIGRTSKTTDGGATWTTTGLGLNWLSSLHFVNENTGYSAGCLERIQKTTDGGNSWTFVNPSGFTSGLNSIYFANINTGLAVGFQGKAFKTTNAGLNWSVLNLSLFTNLNCVYFKDQNTGYICGDNGLVLQTTNTGNIWIIQTTNVTKNLKSILFLNSNTGYITGQTGTLLFTTNAGDTWVNQVSGTNNDLNSICKDSYGKIYIAGRNGNILKRNTGIVNYFTVSGVVRFADNSQPVTSGKVKAIMYDNFTHQNIIVDSADILSNGSYSLTKMPQDSLDIMAFQDDEEMAVFIPTYYASTIYWRNSNTIFPDSNLTGIDINVLRNNPGTGAFKITGNVSTPSLIDNNYMLKNVVIYAKSGNTFKGYSMTDQSGNYSIDGLPQGQYDIIADYLWYAGQTLNLQITNANLNNINFVLQNVIGIEPQGPGLPSEFSLGQNYPNPFNPVTNIVFDLPSATFAKLVIYDLLGREITTIVNEQLRAGTYKVDWNASNYPSGIYFYVLTTENHSESKKMILLK